MQHHLHSLAISVHDCILHLKMYDIHQCWYTYLVPSAYRQCPSQGTPLVMVVECLVVVVVVVVTMVMVHQLEVELMRMVCASPLDALCDIEQWLECILRMNGELWGVRVVVLRVTFMVWSYLAGAILGNPSGAFVFIEGAQPNAIIQAENTTSTPGKLAVSLLTALFDHGEISRGNCTTPVREDIALLDQRKIKAIRGNSHDVLLPQNKCILANVCALNPEAFCCYGLYSCYVAHVQFKYPAPDQDESARWKTILKNNLNSKCRSLRKKTLV